MKWRHWSLLIILLLLNYLIFSAAFSFLARRQQPDSQPTRTPQPTFASVTSQPLTWIIAPTNTPGFAAAVLRPAATVPVSVPVTATLSITAPMTEPGAAPVVTATATPSATTTPAPTPTPTAAGTTTIHIVQRGETLGAIAQRYGVSVAAIVRANNIANPNLIVPGQRLTIPVAGQPLPTATPRPAQPATPRPTRAPTQPAATATRRPPAATATPARQQFTAEIVWHPNVAPNCAGPAISNQSIIRDSAGNPVNGVVVRINCYGNIMDSFPSGMAGAYEAGHYDWSPGQSEPQDWACTARAWTLNGQAIASSQEVTIHFDTNDCRPGGNGHQVAILNWTKWW